MTEAWHLYEVVISNSRVWLKVQSSCFSSEQSAVFLGLSGFPNAILGPFGVCRG